MEIKLSGWKAIAASIVVIGFLGFKFNMQTESLQTEGVEEIKKWLQMESTRAALPDLQKAVEAPKQNEEYLMQMINNLQKDNIEVVSVTRRGVDKNIVARVEVKYKGESQPDRMNVRYYRMNYSMITGWRVERETSKWNYYLASF